ncbi:alpha/beta fold hydrolase [Actinopolyspora mortivallis]|uniref:alpha/beta fold hydrolase n=1 Tax=Actinopolyspora mortivallis TaxID=33906 RepID=UPI000360659E|nr:alpha/beta fold hydrolase [Actinopolyspora mortivallis]
MPRPITAEGGGFFDLAYTREGIAGGTPLLVIPGGPGLASVVPYRSVRRLARRYGFDVVMVEHRGVGLSRCDRRGRVLPSEALTLEAVVDDLVAVLDDCGWSRTVVYGSSYGGTLAQALGAWYPERVRGMVLDSTGSSAAEEEVARDYVRALLWRGEDPATATTAAMLRELVADGLVPVEETGPVVVMGYEFGGTPLLRELYRTVRAGRLGVWNRLARLGVQALRYRRPYRFEPDPVSVIYHRQLRGIEPDGQPLDPAVLFASQAHRYPGFSGEPLDLFAALSGFTWPTAVLSGLRDTRSVRPTAHRVVDSLPHGVLVPFEDSAHSFLDFHPSVALLAASAAAAGTVNRLPDLAERCERLPRPPHAAATGMMLSSGIRAEKALATGPFSVGRTRTRSGPGAHRHAR